MAAPFPMEGLACLSIRAVDDPADPPAEPSEGEAAAEDAEATDAAPEGISPTRSMTNACRENWALSLRNMGIRELSAVEEVVLWGVMSTRYEKLEERCGNGQEHTL